MPETITDRCLWNKSRPDNTMLVKKDTELKAGQEIIDEVALVKLLKEKRIAGAGLDVFSAEKKSNTELLDLPNTILIPHMGSATVEGRIEMGEKVIINIKTFIDGHNPPNRII